MTYFFSRVLNRAEKKCEPVKQGVGKLLAIIIRFEVILGFFEECIDDSKCARTKSAVPFADTLIRLRHVTSSKPDSLLEQLDTLVRKSTYQKEYRPLSLDVVWDSGTVDKFPNLLHQLHRVVITDVPSLVAILAC
jgi:hypothetical protein